MHEEQCGAFLRSLVFRAFTPAQRSYVMGFLTHYAADATLHPYVAAQTAPGGVFARPYGHGFCEVAMDSWFHQTDQAARRPGGHGGPAPVHDPAGRSHRAAARLHSGGVRAGHHPGSAGRCLSRLPLAARAVLFAPGRPARAGHPGGNAGAAQARLGPFAHDPGQTPRDRFSRPLARPLYRPGPGGRPGPAGRPGRELAAEYLREASGYWQGLGSKERLAKSWGDRSYTTGLLSRSAPEADVHEA